MEFITTDSCHKIFVTDTSCDTHGRKLNNLVPDFMPKRIIDILELI